MAGRPARADVAARYDRGVDAYVDLWSDVILPPARAVVAAMGLPATATVVDVGAGTGAVIPSIRAAADRGKVIAIDASREMLRVASDNTDSLAAQGDALTLPLRDDIADAVLFAFVLFHLSDPAEALRQAARVLRVGGTVGTATWARSHDISPAAYSVWDETLTAAGAPPVPDVRDDTGLDRLDAVESLLVATGFAALNMWVEHLSHQWTPDTYIQLASGSGMNRLRLDALDEQTRADTLGLAHRRVSSLEAKDLLWSGDVICAVATLL